MEFRNVDYGTGFETLSAGVSETTPLVRFTLRKRPFSKWSKTHSDGPSRIHQVLHVAFGTTFKNSQDHTHPTTNRFRDMAT